MVGSFCTNSSPFRKNKQDQNNLSFRGKPASRSFSCKCFCSLVTNEPIISAAQECQKKKPFSILPASEKQKIISLKRSYWIQGETPWWHLPAVRALRLQQLSTYKSFKKNKMSQDFDKGKSWEQCFTICPSMKSLLSLTSSFMTSSFWTQSCKGKLSSDTYIWSTHRKDIPLSASSGLLSPDFFFFWWCLLLFFSFVLDQWLNLSIPLSLSQKWPLHHTVPHPGLPAFMPFSLLFYTPAQLQKEGLAGLSPRAACNSPIKALITKTLFPSPTPSVPALTRLMKKE